MWKWLLWFNMRKEEEVVGVHPEGELQISGNPSPESDASLDTFAGKVHVKWVPEAAVSGLGLMVFFIEFLNTSGLFDEFVEDCPLRYTSANAPEKRDVLGTLLLSVLAGHWRYAHINAEARAAVAAALRILNELGVQLHPQKTRIVHVRQGFEFLGYKIKRGKQLRLPPGKIRSGAQLGALYAIPREKSVRRFMDQVRALTSRRVPLKTKELIEKLGREDLCPCGSGRRFQALLPWQQAFQRFNAS